MVCCNTQTYNFINEAITVINTDVVNPFIEVFYLVDGTWIQAGVLTQVKYKDGIITVDHGGVATGVIKVS